MRQSYLSPITWNLRRHHLCLLFWKERKGAKFPATPNSKPRCSCPPDPLKSVVLTQPLGGLCSTLHFVGRSLPSLFEVSSLMAGRWHCWIRSSNSWICSFIHLLIYSTLKTEWVNEQIHKARLSYPLQYSWAPLVAQLVKNPPAT